MYKSTQGMTVAALRFLLPLQVFLFPNERYKSPVKLQTLTTHKKLVIQIRHTISSSSKLRTGLALLSLLGLAQDSSGGFE